MIRKLFQNKSRGQAIALVAVAFAGLVAMVGLMTDGGILLIANARLQRGVDAASIAAAEQFRKYYNPDDLTNAAQEFLQLNQSDVFNVSTQTCDSVEAQGGTDPVLCATPLRKLVRVTASEHVNFGFLRIIGIDSYDITASSVGEAASMDLIMVIDTSISMTFDTNPSDPSGPNQIGIGESPIDCNPTNTCEPMADVKAVAEAFATNLFYPYDRMGIITLTSQTPCVWSGQGDYLTNCRDPEVLYQLQSSGNGDTDQTNVENALAGIKVIQPPQCVYDWNGSKWILSPGPDQGGNNPLGVCLDYPPTANTNPAPPNPPFVSENCPEFQDSSPNDPTTCTSTNAGGALLEAGNEFVDPNIEVRKDSFWGVIMILSGSPNASFGDQNHPAGYCPQNTWGGPFCLQPSLSSPRYANGNSNYTSLDYARDMADWVAGAAPTGQGVSVFTIGLGNKVENSSQGNPTEPEDFLKYAALTAGGSGSGVNHGNYYYAPDPSYLTPILNDIYQNITTRIAK